MIRGKEEPLRFRRHTAAFSWKYRISELGIRWKRPETLTSLSPPEEDTIHPDKPLNHLCRRVPITIRVTLLLEYLDGTP
ncbi:unnamed protein product [Wuchereria bancrofti]|uniref:Uncharacterized protein n=1 Tax=Wuchereria bancrofti TaxID=6293 RepID=A0A3P7E0K6_WUCBA|nr:unnamed protein product [Wuchereria bancrofti]